MPVKALECPKCGAALTLEAGQQHVRCSYCGTNFQPAATPTQAPTQTPTRPHHDPAAAARVVRGVLVGSTLMGVLVVAGTFMLVGKAGDASRSSFGPAVTVPAIPGLPVAPKSGGRTLWDDNGGSPTPARIGDQDAVLGRVRASPEDQLYIAAARADDAAPIYRVGPLGSYSDAYRATHFAVAGERLVVSDHRPQIHVHALATGEQLRSFPLSDRVEALCTSPDGATVGVALVDERRHRLDLGALTLEEGAPPKGCDLEKDPFRRKKDPPGVKAPKVEGFTSYQLLREGELAVSNGYKAPGTAIPHAVGFDPKTGAQRWREVIPAVALAGVQERSNTHAALSAGRFVTVYRVGSEDTHVAAFDAASGARLWDRQLRPIFAVDAIDEVVATARHVFVVRTSSMDILDAATGEPRGTVGDETYDR